VTLAAFGLVTVVQSCTTLHKSQKDFCKNTDALFSCNNSRSHYEFTSFVQFYFHSIFTINFILLVFHTTGALYSSVPALNYKSIHTCYCSLLCSCSACFFALSPQYTVASSSHIAQYLSPAFRFFA
jgi:hypothetical protein